MTNQSITVRNPPLTGPYVMRATMPFARGEDVSGYGNNLGTTFSGNEQQYRIIARTATHDIYEWCVYNKGQEGRSVNSRGVTIDTALISSTYTPPVQVGKGNNTVRRREGGRGGPIDADIGTGQPRDLLNSMLSRLEEPDAVYLEIEGQGWNGTSNFPTTEIVPLTGPQTYSVRAGPIMWTSYKHVTTQHFGSFHFWWTLAMGENHFRLNINWHTGIPRPELLVRGIRLRIRGSTAPGDAWPPPIAAFDSQYNGRWSQWSILSDPALGVVPSGDDNGFYILKNAPAGQYWHMPRMAQRAWRLNLWPAPGANPGQDRGWGVGDWSGGGFLLKDLKVWGAMLDHIGADPASTIISKVSQMQSDLLALVNRTERDGSVLTGGSGLNSEYALFPAIEQAYGGPTGSESLYKPFPGWKAVAANERAGLAEHQILQLRLHSRSWVAMYETDGSPVRPWLSHHLSGGLANWSASLADRYFSMQSGGLVDQYAPWKDAGFNYSSPANRVIRTTRPDFTDRIPLRLQTQGVNRGWGTHTGWPNIDQQHRGIHWPHDLALAWIDADPLSIQYLIGEAEMAHMQYWGATEGVADDGLRGAWGGGAFPGTQGSPILWGRAEGWAFLIISAAAPFTFPTVVAEDSTDPTATRADRWGRGTIATFMDASEFVRSAAGSSWHTNTDKIFDGVNGNPPWDVAANNGPFYCAQQFENNFLSLASAFAITTWGEDFWVSTRNGARVDARAVLLEHVRALDETAWSETTAVSSAAVVAGGSNYADGDVLTVTDELLRTGIGGGDLYTIGNKAKLVATTAAGVVVSVAVSQGGLYPQQPLDETALGGCFTHAEVFAASAPTPGNGYANNQILTLNSGTPVRSAPENHAQFKVTSVNGSGGITGLSLVRTGRYEVPPATSLSGTQFSGGTGTGAVLTISRTSGGSGLRLNLAWAAPVRATRPSGPVKIFPIKKLGVAVPTWTSRADWDGTGDKPPRDMLMRAVFDSFASNSFVAQTLHTQSTYSVLAMSKLLDSPLALKLCCEIVGVSHGDVNALVAAMKAYGIGRIGGSQGIHAEFWWPLYAAWGAP